MKENDALAPFPLYFTPTGEPKTIKVGDNGQAVYVTWDGAKLFMSKEPPKPPLPPFKEGTWLFGWGCWCSLLISLLFWFFIIKLIQSWVK